MTSTTLEMGNRASGSTEKLLFALFDVLPVPLAAFASDGATVFVNEAFLIDFNVFSPAKVVGKLNLLKHLVPENERIEESFFRIMGGEKLSISGVRILFPEFATVYRSGFLAKHELVGFPIYPYDEDVPKVVTVFISKNVHQIRQDIEQAMEFLEEHWLDDFNLDKLCTCCGLSRNHLRRTFKDLLGITLYRYHQTIKIEKMKALLASSENSISDIFSCCGADYYSTLAKAFKKATGVSPKDYKDSLKFEALARKNHLKDLRKTSHFLEKVLMETCNNLPIPVGVSKPNGDIAFVNEAFSTMLSSKGFPLISHGHDPLREPLKDLSPEIEEGFVRARNGETVLLSHAKLPLDVFGPRIQKKGTGDGLIALYAHILVFPIFKEKQLKYVGWVLFTSRVYEGKHEVEKAKEFLENNWKEDFYIEQAAAAAGVSPTHLVRLFKEDTGETPYHYYLQLKITHLKEVLKDRNLSIAQAFLACGFKNPKNSARFFKEQVGMTPSAYRRLLGQ